jgi:hypothetical protein
VRAEERDSQIKREEGKGVSELRTNCGGKKPHAGTHVPHVTSRWRICDMTRCVNLVTSQYRWFLCVHTHKSFEWVCECQFKVIAHLHRTRKCTYITWSEAHWKRSAQTSPTRSADPRETPAKIYVCFWSEYVKNVYTRRLYYITTVKR